MWQRQLGLVKKWSLIVIGGLLVLLGLVNFWLPLPLGVPLIAARCPSAAAPFAARPRLVGPAAGPAVARARRTPALRARYA